MITMHVHCRSASDYLAAGGQGKLTSRCHSTGEPTSLPPGLPARSLSLPPEVTVSPPESPVPAAAAAKCASPSESSMGATAACTRDLRQYTCVRLTREVPTASVVRKAIPPVQRTRTSAASPAEMHISLYAKPLKSGVGGCAHALLPPAATLSTKLAPTLTLKSWMTIKTELHRPEAQNQRDRSCGVGDRG